MFVFNLHSQFRLIDLEKLMSNWSAAVLRKLDYINVINENEKLEYEINEKIAIDSSENRTNQNKNKSGENNIIIAKNREFDQNILHRLIEWFICCSISANEFPSTEWNDMRI